MSNDWEKYNLQRFNENEVFELYIKNNIIERKHTEGSAKPKRNDIEFIDALNFLNDNTIYRKNEIDFWTANDNIVQGKKCCEKYICECEKKCICSHPIKNLYYIKNDAGITCLVGSCCVKKTSSDLHNRLTKDRCVVCNCSFVAGGRDPPTLLDKRGKYQRNGYCSQICSWWPKCSKWKIARDSTTTYFDLVKINNTKHLNWCLKIARKKGKKTLAYYLEQHLQKKDETI